MITITPTLYIIHVYIIHEHTDDSPAGRGKMTDLGEILVVWGEFMSQPIIWTCELNIPFGDSENVELRHRSKALNL